MRTDIGRRPYKTYEVLGGHVNDNATLTDIYQWCRTWGGDPIEVVASILVGLHEAADLVSLDRVAGTESVEDVLDVV